MSHDTAALYAPPGQPGSIVSFESRYENYIRGKWVPPVRGQYFENVSPVNGKVFCEVARSSAADVELALDAAHAAADRWGRTSITDRANILNKIADRIEENLEKIAVAETWENGKPVRETLGVDIPLAVDHFRYFAGVVRSQEGTVGEIDEDTIAYHFHEPLGVVGQIIPWNFPILMAAWKLAPALAAGNCVVIKPAEQTPVSLLKVVELIADLLPPGVLNVVNGFGVEAGKPLASSSRIAKIAFTGETTTGRLIMQYASENIIPVTLELGGKSPNIFLSDVTAADDAYLDKAVEGFVMFAVNQGEVCTCPSRALIASSIYDEFMARALERTKAIKGGNPLDPQTMIGAQASNDQFETSFPTSTSASRKAPKSSPAAPRAPSPAWKAATTSSRPSSRAPTTCASSRRRSSARSSRSPPSTPPKRPRRSPTTPSTASAPACGPATATTPTGSAARSRPDACGPTATTPTRPTRPSAATRAPASAARPTR